jgi:hypothetical protein
LWTAAPASAAGPTDIVVLPRDLLGGALTDQRR